MDFVLYYLCWHRVGSPGQHRKKKISAGVFLRNGDTGPGMGRDGCLCFVRKFCFLRCILKGVYFNWLKN